MKADSEELENSEEPSFDRAYNYAASPYNYNYGYGLGYAYGRQKAAYGRGYGYGGHFIGKREAEAAPEAEADAYNYAANPYAFYNPYYFPRATSFKRKAPEAIHDPAE
jgi:hypothetical protein